MTLTLGAMIQLFIHDMHGFCLAEIIHDHSRETSCTRCGDYVPPIARRVCRVVCMTCGNTTKVTR